MNYFSVCPDAFLTNYYFMLLTQGLHNPHWDCRVSYCCVLCFSPQHFRQRLDKLFAKGIGMLDMALTEAFELLSNVSTN